MSDYLNLVCKVSSITNWSEVAVSSVCSIFVIYCGLSWHLSVIRESSRRRLNDDKPLPKCLLYLTRLCIVACLLVNFGILCIPLMGCLASNLLPFLNGASISMFFLVAGQGSYIASAVSVVYIFFLRLKHTLNDTAFEYDDKVYKLFQWSIVLPILIGCAAIFVSVTSYGHVAFAVLGTIGLSIYVVLSVSLVRLFVNALFRVCSNA